MSIVETPIDYSHEYLNQQNFMRVGVPADVPSNDQGYGLGNQATCSFINLAEVKEIIESDAHIQVIYKDDTRAKFYREI